jgi:hypothetical protein
VKREPLKPEVYARVFDSLPEGKLVLEELVNKFARNPYVKGGLDAQRETDYRAGQLSVPTFIMNRLNQAAGADVPDEEETP